MVLDDAATIRLDAILANWTRAYRCQVLGEIAKQREKLPPLVRWRQARSVQLLERVAMWEARSLESPEPLATEAIERAASIRPEVEALAAEIAEYVTTLLRFDEIEQFVESRIRR